MRILIAPTAFKGTFSPAEVAKAMSEGVSEFARVTGKDIFVDMLPIADGGDGTIEALALATEGAVNQLTVSGSLGEPRQALWLDMGTFAVVEMASACGIAGLPPDNLQPLLANSLGLGTVIKHIIENTSITQIVVAVGGSASTDGGSAAIFELGARFFDQHDKLLIPAGGGSLIYIQRCDLSAARLKLREHELSVLSDVNNPLLGEDGAAYIFAGQKGATPVEIIQLDDALNHFADLVETDIDLRLRDIRGAGAAGGTAFGLAALGAKILPGFAWLADCLGLSERVRKADLVLTGEGRVDKSSLQGKAVGSLHELCLEFQKPLWSFSGSIDKSIVVSESLPYMLLVELSKKGHADQSRIREAVVETLCARFEAFENT